MLQGLAHRRPKWGLGRSTDAYGKPLRCQLPQNDGHLRRRRLVEVHLRDDNNSPVVVPHDREKRHILILPASAHPTMKVETEERLLVRCFL